MIDISSTYEKLKALLKEEGFNLLCRINVEEYDKETPSTRHISNILPEAKSAIIVAFAGKGFWEKLKRFLEENPRFVRSTENWIDEYTVLKITEVTAILKPRVSKCKVVFPFSQPGLNLDFMKLGELGGIGTKSLLGILIHPTYGSWISIRGAILTDAEFNSYDAPLANFTPCKECQKPCINACPAKAISLNGWNYKACLHFRLSTDICSSNCISRRACPYGMEHQYSEEQLAHHQRAVLKDVKKILV
jgi:epoxyqueuosine reductase QueG